MAAPVRIGSEIVVTPTPSIFRADVQAILFEDGGYAVIWHRPTPTGDASFTGVQARFFNAADAPITDEILVNTSTYLNQNVPDSTLLANGNLLVIWADESLYLTDLRMTDLRGQILTPTGAKVGGEIVIPGVLAGDETPGEVIALAGGGFAVAWRDAPQGLASAEYTLRLRILGADGTTGGAEIEVAKTTSVSGIDRIETNILESGNILVSWREKIGADYQKRAQVYSPAGAAVGGVINLGAPEKQGMRSLVEPVSGDRIAVVFEVQATESYSVALHDLTGAIVSPVTVLGERGEIGGVVGREDGGFVVTWTDTVIRAGQTDDVLMRAFFADGTPDGVSTPVSTFSGGDEHAVAVSNVVDGAFVAVWVDDDHNIRAQKFSAETPLPPVTHPGTADNNHTVGGGGDDHITGLGGEDFLFSNGYNPDGTMMAGAGADVLDGGDGNDGLFAGDGADRMFGGDGQDGMVGGGGDDTMFGGAGTDFLFGGDFAADGSFLPNSGNDRLNGGDGNDGLWGQDGTDTVNGDAGDDYVQAGAGNDTINGGAGNDFLLGEDGVDTIAGGAGFDYLYGGAGADVFVYKRGDSADWILDFNAEQNDQVRLEGFGFANFLAIPFVDLSTPGSPAVGLTVQNPADGSFDQLLIFGVGLDKMNTTTVIIA